ncbi:CPBP family intramembrane glutamic endopeptidase [Halomicrobium salinisoli]|uniref:CPBP family intramembrane glutamic endopeptidase n=1 Tax=Halomicrobium salinisoli TaxID=2878391 RepID=UPI001CF021E5|nr:CPBP family intramembrane glutamic endopeptidase [Halomicrobium salinisoli]
MTTEVDSHAVAVDRVPVAAAVVGVLALPAASLALDAVARSPSAAVWNAFKLGVAGVVAAVALRWSGGSPAAVGLRRPTSRDLLWAVGTLVPALAVFALTDPLIEGLGLPTSDGALLRGQSLAAALVTAVVAGLAEEPLYRGVPIEAFADTGLGPLGAGLTTWALFTVVHAPSYPAGTLLQIALVAGVFTAAYLRRRSIVPLIAAHVLLDVAGVLAAVYA